MALTIAAMISFDNPISYGQSARGAYGQFEIPRESSAQARSQGARHPVGASAARGGMQPASSATNRSVNSANNTRKPMANPALGRSTDRLGRFRTMPASYQESIDTGEVVEPNPLPQSNPIADPNSMDSGIAGEMLPLDHQFDAVGNSMSYGPSEGGLYCDDCGDSGCGCNLRGHSLSSINECRLRLSLGVLAFSNTLNFAGAGANVWSGDGSGSFGFQESLQWSTPVPGLLQGEMGAQVGVRTVQANLTGAEMTADGRNQIYLTAGLFRRADYGLQGGLVVDYLGERWYLNTDLVQLRGELSYMFDPNHEFGFRFTSGMQSSFSSGSIFNDAGTLVATSGTFTALDQYRVFTRHVLDQDLATFLELSAGWSDESHGILGGMIETAVSSQLSVQSSFTLGIPGDAISVAEHQHEQWQVGLMMVWTPSRPCRSGLQDYYRPLFEVADPGSFWVGRNR